VRQKLFDIHTLSFELHPYDQPIPIVPDVEDREWSDHVHVVEISPEFIKRSPGAIPNAVEPDPPVPQDSSQRKPAALSNRSAL
jgi:hypothetical protein